MCRLWLWVPFALVSACSARSSQMPNVPPAEALAQRAMAIRTIDPADEDFADLRPIGRALRDARIVLLGEATHGDGATFLAKSRLIKFLHQELGFDVLVFESGFYDCGASGDARFEDCVWPLWWRSDQLKPLIAYREGVAERRPLHLAGMDPDFITSSARPDFAGSVRAMVPDRPVKSVAPSELRAFLEFVDRYAAYQNARRADRPSNEVVESFASTAVRLATAVERDTTLPLLERGYRARVLENLASAARFRLVGGLAEPSMRSVELRDEQMARNLSWLARERYAGRKIVVWTASLHAARNLRAVNSTDTAKVGWGLTANEYYKTKRVMGDYLARDFGASMYAIAFITYDGEFTVAPTSPGRPISPAAPGSLEHALSQRGAEFAFLDLRSLKGEAHTFPARPFGRAMMTAPWGTVLDGFFFVKSMSRSTRKDVP